jgi:hypothetical protein
MTVRISIGRGLPGTRVSWSNNLTRMTVKYKNSRDCYCTSWALEKSSKTKAASHPLRETNGMPRPGTNRPDSDSRFPSKPSRRYCTTLLTRIFSSVSIANAPSTLNVQPLSHTVPNNRVQAIFPASRIIQHQYRVSTDPVLSSFFSAHIPEFTGYTNTNCPSEEFGELRKFTGLRWHVRTSNCWSGFFRPSNPFLTDKRRFRMGLALVHGEIRCRIVPPVFSSSAHSRALLCSGVWTRVRLVSDRRYADSMRQSSESI